jgi:type I restriction enzyme S subunit
VIGKDTELPEGWALSTLAATAALAKDRVDPVRTPNVPYVGLEHVEAHTMRILGHGRGSDVTSLKTKFSAGDVLYGKLRPYLNKVARPDFDGICSTDFLVFKDSPALDSGYLANYLNQLWVAGRAHQLSNGIELPRVDWKSLSQLPIAHPRSRVEQRLIVEQIDAARGFQSSASGHLDAARRAVAGFRQAVLGAACLGRLTADWRERNATSSGRTLAEELEASSVASRRRRWTSFDERQDAREYPDTWGSATFDCLTTNHDGRRVPVKSADRAKRPGPYPYYGASGIIDHVDDFLFEGDFLLISEDGANLLARVTPIAFRASGQFWVNNHAHVVESKSGLVDAYLEIVINGRDIQTYVTGSAQPKLTQAALNEMHVPVPSTVEQREIVRRVAQLFTLADHLEQRIDVASKHIERSSQAVLAKAFRGELFPSTVGVNAAVKKGRA